MNFNVYLDADTGRRLNELAESAGESRDALIRKAIGAWLAGQRRTHWPEVVIQFKGLPEMTALETAREGLGTPRPDPLA